MRWTLGIAIALIASNASAECISSLPQHRTRHRHYRYVQRKAVPRFT